MADPYDQIKDLYTRNAGFWDQNRNCNLVEKKWLDKVLARCPQHPNILYLGCGTGKPIAQYLIEQGAFITGVDFSPTMLGLARSHYPDHIWMEADIRHIDLGRTFVAIINWSAMFHLTEDDQRAMFPIMKRHLTAKGVVLITTGTSAGECSGSVAGETVFHASLDEAEYRMQFENYGFSGIEYCPEDPETSGYTLWLANRQD